MTTNSQEISASPEAISEGEFLALLKSMQEYRVKQIVLSGSGGLAGSPQNIVIQLSNSYEVILLAATECSYIQCRDPHTGFGALKECSPYLIEGLLVGADTMQSGKEWALKLQFDFVDQVGAAYDINLWNAECFYLAEAPCQGGARD